MEQAGTVSAKCPHCGQAVLGPAHDLRTTVRCPRCQRVLVLADIVPLDTPIAAAPVSVEPAPPPRRPLPARTIRMSPASEVAPTMGAPAMGAPTIEQILGSLDAPKREAPEVEGLVPAPFSAPSPDAMGFTAPMSAPPKSAVTPVPALMDATMVAEPPPPAQAASPSEAAPAAEATEIASGAIPPPQSAVPDSGSAPPTRPSVMAPPRARARATPDPLLTRFELVDRYTRPRWVWILLGLGATITVAETFDSLVGSFPIFRTLAVSLAWLGSFVLLAARLAGARGDDGAWSFDAALGELRASVESAIASVRDAQTAGATEKKRLAGRGLFALGLLAFALWSVIDVARLVFSEIFHVAVRARPDVSGHSTVLPFLALAAGGVVLYLVARDERASELGAPREILAQALPLHPTPLTAKQLIEQARLFPEAYHPVLAALATSAIARAPSERLAALSLRDSLRRAAARVEVSADVSAPGQELSSRRVQIVVGKGVFADVTFVRAEADVERAASRARALVDEKRGGLVIVLAVARGLPELRDALTPKIAELRQRAPVLAVWIDA